MPTTVATPTDVEKAKAALRVELSAVADRVAALATGDDQLAAAINEIRALIAILEANEAADDAAHAALVERVAAIEGALARLRALNPALVWEPPPPGPPAPPPAAAARVAALRVSGPGRALLGVPVAAGLIRALGRVRVGGIVAQGDNAVIDRAGWLRWFSLAAIVPAVVLAGDLPIDVSAEPETAPAVATPLHGAHVVVSGRAAEGWRHLGNWRQGPVLTEAVHAAPGDPIAQVRALEQRWADGGAGTAVVIERSGSRIDQPMTAAVYDVTISRGAERLEYTGVQHAPHARWVRRLGDRPAFAAVVPLNGGSTWQQFIDAGVIDNYTWDSELPSLAPLDVTPDAPFAVTTGPAPGVSHEGSIGLFSRAQGSPGGNPDIGDQPYYYLQGLRRFSPDALRLITWHADKRLEAPYFRRGPDGSFVRMDDTDHNMGIFERAAGTPYVANQFWAPSHWGAMFDIPYAVTGDLLYLEGQMAQQLVSWASTYPTDPVDKGNGNKLTRHPLICEWIDATKGVPAGFPTSERGSGKFLQWRTQGWGVRTTVHLLASMPHDDERMRALTGWDRTMVATLWANVQAWAKRAWIDTHTGEGKRFAVDGLHPAVPNIGGYKTWMWAMAISSLSCGRRRGVLSADGDAYYRWCVATPIGIVNDPKVIPEFMMFGNLATVTFDGSGAWGGFNIGSNPNGGWHAGTAPARTFADTYRGTAQFVGLDGGGYSPRYVDNPVAILLDPPTASFGEERAFVLTPAPGAGPMFPNPASYGWYKDTLILVRGDVMPDPAGFIEQSVGLIITEVTGPNTGRVVVGHTAKGQQASIGGPIGSVVMGWPCPADGRPRGEYPPMGEPDYIGWFSHLAAQGVDHGVPGAAEALAWLRAYHARHNLPLNPTHMIEPRV